MESNLTISRLLSCVTTRALRGKGAPFYLNLFCYINEQSSREWIGREKTKDLCIVIDHEPQASPLCTCIIFHLEKEIRASSPSKKRVSRLYLLLICGL